MFFSLPIFKQNVVLHHSQAEQRFDGALDILVNNVGRSIRKASTFDYTPEEFAVIIDTNFNSVLQLTQVCCYAGVWFFVAWSTPTCRVLGTSVLTIDIILGINLHLWGEKLNLIQHTIFFCGISAIVWQWLSLTSFPVPVFLCCILPALTVEEARLFAV